MGRRTSRLGTVRLATFGSSETKGQKKPEPRLSDELSSDSTDGFLSSFLVTAGVRCSEFCDSNDVTNAFHAFANVPGRAGSEN